MILIFACGEPTRNTATPTLVACASTTAQSTSATILPALGGAVTVAGSRVTLPVGAVTLPTIIQLTVPASPYMEIEVRANGLEQFLFAAPVTIAIEYSRCSSVPANKPVGVWRIDAQTKALLENMNGTDDRGAKTVAFTTGHLSSYAIAE